MEMNVFTSLGGDSFPLEMPSWWIIVSFAQMVLNPFFIHP